LGHRKDFLCVSEYYGSQRFWIQKSFCPDLVTYLVITNLSMKWFIILLIGICWAPGFAYCLFLLNVHTALCFFLSNRYNCPSFFKYLKGTLFLFECSKTSNVTSAHSKHLQFVFL
jgi:hypothetical protein